MNKGVDNIFSVRRDPNSQKPLQLNELDKETRVAIFNAIYRWKEYIDFYGELEMQNYLDMDENEDTHNDKLRRIDRDYLSNWLYKALPDIKDIPLGYTFMDIQSLIMHDDQLATSDQIKRTLTMNKVFDLIEFLIDIFSTAFNMDISNENNNVVHKLIESLNKEFKSHNVGYLILPKTGLFTPITNEVESKNLEYSTTTPFSETNKHIKKALECYRNKEYSDVVEKSIKAMESMCKEIVGDNKATLSGAIKKMKQELPDKTHQALFESIDKLYGYASDTVRHAKIDNKSEPTESEARFVLMTCSSIINYLVELNINNQSK